MTDLTEEVARAAWRPGDRAYCIQGSQQTRPTLEIGKVYTVQDVIPVRGYSEDGLILSGVSMPEGVRGIWGWRFVKMPDLAHLKEDRP